MPAGILLKELATNPMSTGADGIERRVGAPLLAEQHVACGPSPSVSAKFRQDTLFVELTVGINLDPNRVGEERAIHYQIGLDPLPTLIENWKRGVLPAPTIPLANGARVLLPVVGGSRIALLGLNLEGHDHPRSPTLSRAMPTDLSTNEGR